MLWFVVFVQHFGAPELKIKGSSDILSCYLFFLPFSFFMSGGGGHGFLRRQKRKKVANSFFFIFWLDKVRDVPNAMIGPKGHPALCILFSKQFKHCINLSYSSKFLCFSRSVIWLLTYDDLSAILVLCCFNEIWVIACIFSQWLTMMGLFEVL